jgi:nitrogen regulatory protein P-II 1
MQKIEALIREDKLEDLKKLMNDINVHFAFYAPIEVFAKRYERPPFFEGVREMYEVEMVVSDAMANKIVDRIIKTCRTDSPGDGKVMVHRIEHIYRISTGEVDL